MVVAATLGTAVALLVLGLGVAQASKRRRLQNGRQDRRQSEGCTSTDDESDDTLLVIPKTHAKQEPAPLAAAAAAAAFAGNDGGSAGAGPPELVMLNDAAHLLGTFGGTNASFDAGAGESGVLQHAESAFPSTARQYHTSQMHADGTAAARAQVCTTAAFAALGAAAVHAATFQPATESSSHPLKELEKISSQFTASSVSASTSSSDDGSEPMPEGAAASPSAVVDAMLDHNHDNLDVVKECEDLARELGVDCCQELDLTRACAVGDADSAALKVPAPDDSDAAGTVVVKGGPNGAPDGSNSEQALKVNGKWEDWVLNLTLKERNVLSLKHGFSEEEADHLKQSTRKYKRARAQRRYHKKRAVAAGNSHARSVSAHHPVLPTPADLLEVVACTFY